MILDYIPEVCQKEGASVTGSLKIQMMSFPERSRLRKQVGLSAVKNKESGDENSSAAKLENLELIAEVSEKIFPLIKEVNLKCGDAEIKTADDLYGHPECEAIISELIEKFLFGFAAKNS